MRLDPRSPLVINTHELGRRPGSMRTLELSVPAPEDLGIELIGVPAGSPVEVELRLEAVMEGVLASGRAWVTLSGECARCLEPLEDDLEVTLQELYVYPESDAEEDEASRLEGELLDLEPVLRDAVVLALPFRPVCTPDCPGLCLECGARLQDDPGHTHEESIDPRWAALSTLTTNAADGPVGSDEE
ncbi:MAG: hypothetical protein QOK30_2568 [Nocardioidaceae bacterium]|jgi:uncharacterized protein|nr:hypothetical protein [Nocardioidaceae bacterium]